MNEEIDDSEFYHEDFTTASDWEIFIAHMEEIINQWKSDDLKEGKSKELTNNIWEIKSEKLVFVDSNFDFIWYKRICDEETSEGSDDKTKHPLDKWHDFVLFNDPASDHKDICLANWYGLDEFIVITPAGNLGTINNESKTKILLSSACVLVNNLSLEVPIFIQIRDKWQKLYVGVYEADGIRTNFDIVHLKRGPHYCQYLTGVLDLFKTKIMSPCMIDNILLSFQATYILEDFGNFIWKQDVTSEHLDFETLFILPFGVTVEPISAIYLKAIWNHLSEHSVMDSESYTDFDPLKAPKWHSFVKLTKEPVCLLGECLSELYQILNNSSSVYDILGDFAAVHVPESNPLDVLTEPSVPTISTSITTLLSRAARTSLTRNKRGNPPLHETVLVPLLYFLFPDADENSSFPYGEKDDKEPLLKKNKLFNNLEDEFKGFKTCMEDSLIWRLSIVLSHTLQSLGGLKAFCHIWYEFIQEMRYRWEKSMLIPGTAYKSMEPIILVHGGAGNVPDSRIPLKINGNKKSVEAGYKILENGGSALDAVEAAIRVMEDDEAFNAGYGSVLNLDGDVEMDASVMVGSTLQAGAVTIVKDIAHPISLARLVMEKTPHVLLAGTGANKFAKEEGIPTVSAGSLVSTFAKKALEEFKKKKDYRTELGEMNPGEVGTVGAVAIDKNGNLAAATSTGGVSGKMVGRSSGTSMIGCGTYADNNVGAVSTTGHGESIIKYCLAHSIIKDMEYNNKSANEATNQALERMTERLKNTAGAITVSKTGKVGIGFTSKRMSWAYRRANELHYGINKGQHEVEKIK